jgi:hypothetical protein
VDYLTTLSALKLYRAEHQDDELEGRGHGLIEVLPQHLPGGTQVKYKLRNLLPLKLALLLSQLLLHTILL